MDELNEAPKTINLSLNFDDLRGAHNIWLRRTYVFLGIGSNSPRANPPIPWKLDSRAQYDYGFAPDTPDQHQHFLDEFAIWTVGNGFRELIEGHSTFLARMNWYLRIFEAGGATVEQLQRWASDFDKNNVLRRREKLARRLGVSDPFADMFASIVKARNCFAHRMGVVGAQDVDPVSNALELRWRFHGLRIGGEYADVNQEEPIQIEADQRVQFGPVERSKSFQPGEQIILTRHELAEIIFGVHIAAETLIEPFRTMALSATKETEA